MIVYCIDSVSFFPVVLRFFIFSRKFNNNNKTTTN